jgi:hypothetical protein
VDPRVAYLGPNVREKEKAGTINRRQLIWASAYRSMCRAKDGDIPSGSGRLSKNKPEVRDSYIEPRESEIGTDTPIEGVGEGTEEVLEDEDVLDGFEEPEGDGEVEGDGDTGLVGHYDRAMDVDMEEGTEAEADQEYDDGGEEVDLMENR